MGVDLVRVRYIQTNMGNLMAKKFYHRVRNGVIGERKAYDPEQLAAAGKEHLYMELVDAGYPAYDPDVSECTRTLTIQNGKVVAGYVITSIVPSQVSPYQARVALKRAGLLGNVKALMANPATDKEAQIAWEYATVIQRDSPFIAALSGALGLTSAQIDDLFRAAVKVK